MTYQKIASILDQKVDEILEDSDNSNIISLTINSEHSELELDSELYDLLKVIAKYSDNSKDSNSLVLTIDSESYELNMNSDLLERLEMFVQ